MEVAKLTAPITVTIPFEQIRRFLDELEKIADVLENIVVQLNDMGKAAKKNTKDMAKGIRITNKHVGDVVRGNKTIINQEKQKTKEAKKGSRAMGRTSKAWGGFANILARIRVGIGLLKFAFNILWKAAAVPVSLLTGTLLLGARVNRLTTEMVNLSRAVGMSTNDMKALGLAAKEFGFTFEHVNSLVEELNNKFGGEEGGFIENNLREGLSLINIEAEKMQKLKPEKRLEMIMEAGRKLSKDSKNLDRVASAYDRIFGQEGNRLLTGFTQKMIKNNQTWGEFVRSYGRFTDMTKENLEGAVSFTDIWNKGLALIGRGFNNFFGGIGAKLAPTKKELETLFITLTGGTKSLSETFQNLFIKALLFALDIILRIRRWIIENQEKIKELSADLLDTLESVWMLLESVWDLLKQITGWDHGDGLDNWIATLDSIRWILKQITDMLTAIEEFFDKLPDSPFGKKKIETTVGFDAEGNPITKQIEVSGDPLKGLMRNIGDILGRKDIREAEERSNKRGKVLGGNPFSNIFNLIKKVGSRLTEDSDEVSLSIETKKQDLNSSGLSRLLSQDSEMLASTTNNTRSNSKVNSDNVNNTTNYNTFNLEGQEAADAILDQLSTGTPT